MPPAARAGLAGRRPPALAGWRRQTAVPRRRRAGFVWTPTVDDDMVELFFDEAHERLEALAGKLVEIERRPDDAELLRDVFRDLHTIKGIVGDGRAARR